MKHLHQYWYDGNIQDFAQILYLKLFVLDFCQYRIEGFS
jgi:hypothetical protein